MLPKIPKPFQFRDADRYEMVGIIDVVTHVELNEPTFQNNLLLKEVLKVLPVSQDEKFEVIVDYKRMRRPSHKNGTRARWSLGAICLATSNLWRTPTSPT